MLSRIDGAPRATRLAELAVTLPSFVSSAVFAHHHARDADAIVFGWVVIEQIVAELWRQTAPGQTYTANVGAAGSGRPPSANQMIRQLHAAGQLSRPEFAALDLARTCRNSFVHHAQVESGAVNAIFDALDLALRFAIGGIA